MLECVCGLVFLLSFLGLLLFCSLCLLEWSRCCSCLFFLGSFCLCLLIVCLCLFLSVSYENHCVPCNSGIFWLNVGSICVSHFCFWFLFFVFVLFVTCFKMFLCFCFCSLLSCFLNHKIRCPYALHLVFLLFFWFVVFWSFVFLDFWLPIKRHLSKY